MTTSMRRNSKTMLKILLKSILGRKKIFQLTKNCEYHKWKKLRIKWKQRIILLKCMILFTSPARVRFLELITKIKCLLYLTYQKISLLFLNSNSFKTLRTSANMHVIILMFSLCFTQKLRLYSLIKSQTEQFKVLNLTHQKQF